MKSAKFSLVIGSVLLLGLTPPSSSAPTDLFLLDVSFSSNVDALNFLHQDLLYHGVGGIGLGLAGGLLTAGVGIAPHPSRSQCPFYSVAKLVCIKGPRKGCSFPAKRDSVCIPTQYAFVCGQNNNFSTRLELPWVLALRRQPSQTLSTQRFF